MFREDGGRNLGCCTSYYTLCSMTGRYCHKSDSAAGLMNDSLGACIVVHWPVEKILCISSYVQLYYFLEKYIDHYVSEEECVTN